MNTKFICFYTNVDTLSNKKDELSTLIFNKRPHIIALTETKPKNSRYDLQEVELEIPDYEQFSNLKGTRGVSMFIHKTLNPRLNAHLTNLPFNESIWCEIEIMKHEKLLVGCIYRSPNSNFENDQQLRTLLTASVATDHAQTLIMGDFNCPEINWVSESCSRGINYPSSELIECLRDCF